MLKNHIIRFAPLVFVLSIYIAEFTPSITDQSRDYRLTLYRQQYIPTFIKEFGITPEKYKARKAPECVKKYNDCMNDPNYPDRGGQWPYPPCLVYEPDMCARSPALFGSADYGFWLGIVDEYRSFFDFVFWLPKALAGAMSLSVYHFVVFISVCFWAYIFPRRWLRD